MVQLVSSRQVLADARTGEIAGVNGWGGELGSKGCVKGEATYLSADS